MSLLHSFYAWGQVATIIITTLFLFVFGERNWVIIVLLVTIGVVTAGIFMARQEKRRQRDMQMAAAAK